MICVIGVLDTGGTWAVAGHEPSRERIRFRDKGKKTIELVWWDRY